MWPMNFQMLKLVLFFFIILFYFIFKLYIIVLVCQAGFRKGRGTRDQIANRSSKKQESSRKHLFLLYWLCQSLWLCGSQQTVANSSRNGNTRPPDHEVKRHLLLRRKVMTNLGSRLKSRSITLPTKVRLVKAMVFPIVMCWCESWTIKKAKHKRIDAFKLGVGEDSLESLGL